MDTCDIFIEYRFGSRNTTRNNEFKSNKKPFLVKKSILYSVSLSTHTLFQNCATLSNLHYKKQN